MRQRLASVLFWVLIVLVVSACQSTAGGELYAPVSTPSLSGVEYELISQALYDSIEDDQAQEIRVWVRHQGKPLINVQPVLALTMPDGNTQPYRFPPTNGKGETYITVFPIRADKGTLVPFRVCLYLPQAEEKCVQDSYLIWDEK